MGSTTRPDKYTWLNDLVVLRLDRSVPSMHIQLFVLQRDVWQAIRSTYLTGLAQTHTHTYTCMHIHVWRSHTLVPYSQICPVTDCKPSLMAHVLLPLLVIDTIQHCCSLVVERLHPSGEAPTPRAYHTFNAMGNKCYVVGGRTTEDSLIKGSQMLRVYDVVANDWTCPDAASGSLSCRSSHKAVVVGRNRLILCGGSGKSKLRMDDTHLLRLDSEGRLSWRALSVSPFSTGAC